MNADSACWRTRMNADMKQSRNKIEWHRVTWYSKLATVVAFLIYLLFVWYLHAFHYYISSQIEHAVRVNIEHSRMPVRVFP